MRGDTHAIGGVGTGLVYAAAAKLSLPLTLATVGIATVGALFPDIDIRTSKAGSKIKPLSTLIHKLFGHRTLFHSPLLYLILSISLQHALPQFGVCWTAFFLGVMSHLLLDMLNPKGIPLLYPYPKKYRLARMKCGGKEEKIIRAMLTLNILLWVGIFSARGEIALPHILSHV